MPTIICEDFMEMLGVEIDRAYNSKETDKSEMPDYWEGKITAISHIIKLTGEFVSK